DDGRHAAVFGLVAEAVADRAGDALPAAGADPGVQAARADGNAGRLMTTSSTTAPASPASPAGAGRTVRFAPYNVGRWLVWGLTALLFAVLPLVYSSGFAITLLSQMGIMIVFALSYNVIFGQGGMLSFGHAVYSGLGAFFAIHALNWVG